MDRTEIRERLFAWKDRLPEDLRYLVEWYLTDTWYAVRWPSGNFFLEEYFIPALVAHFHYERGIDNYYRTCKTNYYWVGAKKKPKPLSPSDFAELLKIAANLPGYGWTKRPDPED